MKKLIIFTIISFSLNGQDLDSLFNHAGKEYEEQNYKLALEYYQEIEMQEMHSSDLYFNIGNCYYKLSQNALAVLYYEKSLKINPTLDEAKFNLSLVKSKLVDKIPQVPLIFYKEWTRKFTNSLSVDDWAKIALVFIFIFCVFISFFLFSSSFIFKKIMLFLSSSSLSIGFLSLIVAFYSYSNMETNAILISENSYIKSAPSFKSEDLFILHEGTKVLVLEEFKGWNKIKLSDGMIGWVEKETLREI